MKSYLSLAHRELKAQKVMAVLILTAVVLSCMMTTAVGQSLGILQAMRIEQARSLNGDRYVSFHQLTKEQKNRLEEDPRLFGEGSLINVGYSRLENSSLTLYVREYLDRALDAYPAISRVKSGRLPVSPLEIALPENALPYLGDSVCIGDRIALPSEIARMDGSIPDYSYSAEYKVCGILESSYIGYSTGTLTAIAGAGTAAALLPEDYLLYSTDFKVKDSAAFQPTVDDLADSLSVEASKIQYNWILLDALGISYDEAAESKSGSGTGFSFMALACLLVGALVLLAAGLVIYNILKIAVTKRLREYGTLRAIGAERGQLYRIVSLQLLLLCGIGLPVGLLAGALSAKGILTAATGILNPNLFLADSADALQQAIAAAGSPRPLFFFASALVTLSFAVFAAFPAAKCASRVSPTVAMSGQSIKIRRRVCRIRRIRNFEAWYARLNLKRGRSRTAITILSLVMSTTVFVSLQSFTSLLDASRSVQEMSPGDYAVTSETVGISPAMLEKIRAHELVESVSTTKLSVYTQDEAGALPVSLDIMLRPGEAFQIAGIDDARLCSYTDGLLEQDQADLLSGTACIVKNPTPIVYEGKTYDATSLSRGDTITVNGHPLRIVGVAEAPVTINNEGYLNGVHVTVSDQTYDLLTGNDRYAEVYLTLEPNADREAFEDWLKSWCEENPGSHWLSYQQTAEQLAESFQQIRMLCVGLIFFIGLIGILNIINTVYSNIHTRISEIGMQRAIGMSAGSLYRTFLWEGAYYGIIASVAGGILGYLCTVLIQAAATDRLQPVAVPLLSILEASGIAVAACLLATAVPLRAIARMDIVTSIEAAE